MLRVRVIAATPKEAESVCAQLVTCGFDVEIATPNFPAEGHVDFELHLERSTVRQSVLRAAAETVPEMVMVAPGLLARREIAIPKIPPQRAVAVSQAELAATGTCAEAGLAPVEVKVIRSGGSPNAGVIPEAVSAEIRFVGAVRQAQVEAMRGFASPREKATHSLLSQMHAPAARCLRVLTLALGRGVSLAGAFLGYLSSR
jgi:hypothetical protein